MRKKIHFCDSRGATRLQELSAAIKIFTLDKSEVVFRTTRLRKSIDKILPLIEKRISASNINFSVELSDDCIVLGSAQLFPQVLLNLVVNSIHAVEGCQKRRYRFGSQMNGILTIHVVIWTRIRPWAASMVFEPFVSTKIGKGGTGIGLSFCKKIVESMSGTIRFLPTSPTTVEIILPVSV